MDQQQPPDEQSSIQMLGQDIAGMPADKQVLQDLAKYDVQTIASGVAEMQLTGAVDEETTMCLREQLIHSRCTESRCVLSHTISAVKWTSAVRLCWCVSKSAAQEPSLSSAVHRVLARYIATFPCRLENLFCRL